MNRSLIAIFLTVVLDAMGMGIIFPILPTLLEDLTHADNVALLVGLLTALYAVMQFIFAPLLGALSDRAGRRPVLLLSLGGAAVSYLFLAFASTLPLLLVGRAIAGITGASLSVAMACLTDITPEEKRARRFGWFNAMFGIGFLVGPVLGGLLGDYQIRLPFIAAALLYGGNFLLTLFVLPETRAAQPQKIDLSALNPLRPLRWIFTVHGIIPIVLIFFIVNFAGEAYGICWAMWGNDVFQWNGTMTGLSLAVFGLFQTLVQIFLPGPAVRRLGERGAVLAGTLSTCIALGVIAFATHSWIVFLIMPMFALGGIGAPALQSLTTRQVSADQQGQLQGVLTSVISLASVIAPLFFSAIYYAIRDHWPGEIWLVVSIVEALAIPLVIYRLRGKTTESPRET